MSPAPPPANTTQQDVPIIRDNNFAKEDSGRDAATVSIVPATSNAQPHTSGQWSPFLSLRLLLFRNVRVEERSEVTAEAFGLNWPRPALVYLLACLVRCLGGAALVVVHAARSLGHGRFAMYCTTGHGYHGCCHRSSRVRFPGR